MRRVNVSDFKSCALARQASRPKRRQTPLVGNFRKRVRLVHELRKLRGPEELADGCHHRLGIDQVVRHGRGHFLVHAHLLFNGALHAHQTDAELVLEQLAHRAHPPVAEMIDVIHSANVLAQFQQILDGRVEVVRFQRAVVELGRVLIFKQLDVELQPAHARKVVFARIEKHAVKQRRRSIQCRRITWPQLAVDLDQRFLRRIYRVTLQGLADDRANVVPLGEEQVQLDNTRIQNLRKFIGRQF